jgi:DedD protein
LVSDADNLEIKKRARRRLVGAVALALLAAVVLPVMMDHEPRSSVQDIQITIPGRDDVHPLPRPVLAEAGRVQDNSPDDRQEDAAPVLADANTAAPPSSARPVEPADAVATAAGQAVRTEPPAPPKIESRPSVEPRPAPAPPPAVAAATAEDAEAARVRAILSGQPVPARNEAFVVQVAAFSDAAKATRLVEDLKGQGFANAYTEKAGAVTRVRVGPVSGREAADRLAARLKSAGHTPVLQPR